MPELSRFYGIIIRMYYDDHGPPHFHAVYGGASAKVDIGTLGIVQGRLPTRAYGFVAEWASLDRQELREAWERRTRQEPLGSIEPLP